MFRAVPRLVVTSEPTLDRLTREYGAAYEQVSVVMPGIGDPPRSTGSSGPGCAILSVGALIPRKGHDVLLRALGRLFDLQWHLTIAGSSTRDPVHANGLHALAEKLHIGRRVEFVEEIDRSAVAGSATCSRWRRISRATAWRSPKRCAAACRSR